MRKGQFCEGEDPNMSVWVETFGEGMAQKCNRFVDFLENMDVNELRPRRYYLVNTQRCEAFFSP
jgi:hypothetical protein